jgi:2-oxoglutarate dehydrogenase E2 component (dihydrolipoamide succinyltransferase)
VRTLARREEVDLASVDGTGRDGRITREDVLRHLEKRKAGPEGPEQDRTESAGPGDRREPLSPVRRVIADRLAESKDTIPHSTTVMEADLSTVAALRARERDAFEDREGVSLTYLPFVAHAAVRALEEHPKMNAVLEGEEIRYRSVVNLGIAVATEEGLVVPVVHGAEGLPFVDLARGMRDAAADARTGRLRPEDVQGGTFTLTNHGRGGSLWGTPIIVPGQTGILGVGKVRDVPVAVGGEVEVSEACYLSLSFDHRTVDGAEADEFLRSIVERLASFDVTRLGGKR